MISGEWVWFDCLKFFAIVGSTNPQKGCATNYNNNSNNRYNYNNVVHAGDDAFDMLLTAKRRPLRPSQSTQDSQQSQQWQQKDIWLLPWQATQGNPHVACCYYPAPGLNRLETYSTPLETRQLVVCCCNKLFKCKSPNVQNIGKRVSWSASQKTQNTVPPTPALPCPALPCPLVSPQKIVRRYLNDMQSCRPVRSLLQIISNVSLVFLFSCKINGDKAQKKLNVWRQKKLNDMSFIILGKNH